MTLSLSNPFDDPFASDDYRRRYCKPNSSIIDATTFWTRLREDYDARQRPDYTEFGIHFKGLAVLPIEDINRHTQLARSYDLDPDHVSTLMHSFNQRGWDIAQPLIHVGSLKQLRQVCNPNVGLQNISEPFLAVTGKQRLAAITKLLKTKWTSKMTDPHQWRTVFTHLLVEVYEYDSPRAIYMDDLLTNVHGLPSLPTRMKDIEYAMKQMTDLGCVTPTTPEGLAQIQRIIELAGAHLTPQGRRNIQRQYEQVVTTRGEQLTQIPAEKLPALKDTLFHQHGIPAEKMYFTEDGRLTRPVADGLTAWASAYRSVGDTRPIMVAGYLPVGKTTTRTKKTLATMRQDILKKLSAEREDHVETLTTLLSYVLSRIPNGRTWADLTLTEQHALVRETYPVQFAGFLAQNAAPNPHANGVKMETERTLVLPNGQPSPAVTQWYEPTMGTAAPEHGSASGDLLTQIFATPQTQMAPAVRMVDLEEVIQ